jgi:AcrR family transcriptional regulator
MATPLDRREVILERAADLFAKQGVAATTVREIAEAVGILSGSLYHHFPSKDAIVEAIVTAFMDDLVRRYDVVLSSDADPATKVRGLVAASIATSAEHPHATEIYQSDSHYLQDSARPIDVRQGARAVRAAWIKVLEDGQADGTFRADVPVKVVYPLLRDGLWLTARWFVPTKSYGFDELAADYMKVFLEGIGRGPSGD